MLPKISIIIPTNNESQNLPLLLSDLSIINQEAEVIVVDSHSEDKTEEIAKIYSAKIYKSKIKSRGLQLNIGAKKAKGEWLIFIHADSRLDKNFSREIKRVLIGDKEFIYFFKFKINDKKIVYRLLEILVNLRSCIFKEPYGDQGLIIHRNAYFKNNGYSKIPLMEDIDFIKRLNNKKRLRMLNVPIYTSSRKWGKNGILLQTFKNWKLRKRWIKGESIQSIYIDYYKK